MLSIQTRLRSVQPVLRIGIQSGWLIFLGGYHSVTQTVLYVEALYRSICPIGLCWSYQLQNINNDLH